MNTQQQIIEAVAENLALPASDIDLETSLHDDLSLNPVEIADLLAVLSKKFQIFFDPLETAEIKIVGDLVNLIEDKMLE